MANSALTLTHMQTQRCRECDADLSTVLASTIVYRGRLLCYDCRDKVYSDARSRLTQNSRSYKCTLV